jgi:hypothetical protein
MIEDHRIEDHVICIHLLHDLRSPRFPGSPRGAAHRAVPGEDLKGWVLATANPQKKVKKLVKCGEIILKPSQIGINYVSIFLVVTSS